jgi:hypothetical protein
VQMSSLKWLGVWGIVGNSSTPNRGDKDKWSKSMANDYGDKKKYYLNKFFNECNIDRPDGECKHFQNFTIRPKTCNFK